METPEHTVGPYRALGLVSNPFLNVRNRDNESLAMALEIQSQANRLIASVDMAAAAQRGAIIWVEKSDQVHGSYQRSALIEAEKALLHDEDLNVLPAYVQLFVAKVGRIRSVLNVVAERLATGSFDQTLAAWLSPLIDNPDTELDEWASAEGDPWDEFARSFKVDSLQALAGVFGPNVMFRALEAEPPIDLRSVNLEEEPEETDVSPEDDASTAVIPEAVAVDELSDGESDEAVVDVPDPVYLYLLALARKTLSPVVARGLKVYATRGAAPLSDELKITKAPRKTLKALADLATARYRKVVVVFDGYDNWNMMPQELRAKYVGALSEMKLLLGSEVVMVFLVSTDEAPELDEMFGGGTRLAWDFPNITELKDAGLKDEFIESWIADATLPGSEPAVSARVLLDAFQDEATGNLEAFCAMAAAAIEDMADRGSATFDETAVAAGKAVAPVA